jgi:curved DNA-binding protein CbpA
MKKTLYDLLEVSQGASGDTIKTAYECLSQKYDPNRPENVGDQDAEIQYKLIKEAYSTLSDPMRRGAYDASLNKEVVHVEVEITEPFWTKPKIALVAVLGFIGAGLFAQYSLQREALKRSIELQERAQREFSGRSEQVRQQEMMMEYGTVDPAALAEQRQRREEARLEREQAARERQQQYQLEATRRYAEQVTRERERAEQQAARDEERQRLAEQRVIAEQQRKQDYERQLADRRAKQEQYELERKLRQLEYERSGSKVREIPD